MLLDRIQAGNFLRALRRLDWAVRRGKLDDKTFYSFDIHGLNDVVLGVDLGIEASCPYIGVEDTRVNISAEDLAYLAAACMQMQHLAGGIGVAHKIASAPPGPQPIWENFAGRFCNNGERPWYADD